MQNKGTLGSIIAGVIAIFLVIVCVFYLSFSFVSNHFEGKAEEYALSVAGEQGMNSDQYNKAKKNYLDSLSKKPIYLGYNYNEVQKWGVGLGLDLKGGMNVILQVSMPDILRSMKNADPDPSFDQAIVKTDSIVKKDHLDDYVGAFVKQYRALNPNADFSVVFNGTVKRGDSDNAVAATLKNEVKDRVNNSATNVLRSRIDAYGVVSPNIQVLQGKDGQILLELPGVKEHQRVRELLQRSANLEFYETYKSSEIINALTALDAESRKDNGVGLFNYFAQIAPSESPAVGMARAKNREAIDSIVASAQAKRILPANLRLRWEKKPQVVQYQDTVAGSVANDVELYTLIALKTNAKGEPALDGSKVISASTDQDPLQGNVVSMRMNNEGAKQWARITGANLGKSVAIVLDDVVYSYPRVNSVIEGGNSQITGQFSIEEAQDLANVLKSGKMSAKVEIISDLVIGPSLGEQAIKAGFLSFAIALVLLMIFMGCIYGIIPGLVADFGLVCNLFFTFGILASFQAVLTLSGIAGIVLALGMAVDANVLIFERTKEELRAGKNVRQAIADGYSNAFSAIFDSNLTSIITGVILLYFGTGPIKGFATTLIIGIICSFFTAVFLTRIVFIIGAKSKAFQSLTFDTKISRNFLLNTHVNFLGQRKAVGIIILVSIIGIGASFFIRGLNQGIDFSGGRNYVVKFEKPVDSAELQQVIAPQFPNSTVSVITIGDAGDQVRVSTNYKIDDEDAAVEQEIVEILFNAMKPYMKDGMVIEQFGATDDSQGIISSQKVGPTVADDMRADAIIAVLLSLIAMFLYILIRFRNIAYSLGALAAVAFTAFTIIGFYSIFWGILPFAMEVDQTFIAAILTVIGYQINDTVVVFDRVRENRTLYPKKNLFETINLSINSTLSRTVMTSCTTLLVLICIFVLGGDSLRSFIFAMIFGVIIGTLATIYIATPVAYLVGRKKENK
ncbi:MAG: protein translocase subunit SecD [Muribaculaceae bacterium]|nr:protein translocase subunit SecD [Muribaculaceae bacterium]